MKKPGPDHRHPLYCPAMHLLACIPPYPGFLEVDAIKEEMMLDGPDRHPVSIDMLITELRQRHGVHVMVRRRDGQWALSVPVLEWDRASAIASRYWLRTHPAIRNQRRRRKKGVIACQEK